MPVVFTNMPLPPPNGEDVTPSGINDSGEIIGYFEYGTDIGVQQSFIYSNGTYTVIGQDDTLTSISSAGTVIGFNYAEGFTYSNGTFTALNDPSGQPGGTQPLAINPAGTEIWGIYYTSGIEPPDAFTYVGGTFTTVASIPVAVNASGASVGNNGNGGGYLDVNGTVTQLNDTDAGAGQTFVAGINASDVVVGSYTNFDNYYGFIYANGIFTTFEDPSAYTGQAGRGTHATGINDSGEIVGWYDDSSGNAVGYTLTFAPIANADTNAVYAGASVTTTAGTGVLSNDVDPYGTTLTVTAVKNAASTSGTVGQSLAGTYGHLTLNSNGSYSYVADNTSAINSAANGSHPTDVFTYTVTDADNYTSTATLSIAVDRAPGSTTHNVTVVQGMSTGRVSAGDADPDADGLTVTALSGGTVGTAKAGTYGSLTIFSNDTYSYTANSNTTLGNPPTDTFTYTVSDGNGGTATETLVFTVQSPPALTMGAAAVFVENGGPVSLNSGGTVTDQSRTALTSATVALSGGTYTGDGDILAANTTGTSITAVYNSTTETLTLTGSNSLADYQTVLNSVTFNSTSQNPDDYGTHPTRTVTWTLNDGNATGTASLTVSVTAVNNPPTLTGSANATFTENNGAVTLSGAAAVSDSDNLKLAGATVAISGGTFAGDSDVLAADTAGTSITASYNSSTETLTLSGSDTLAHYQQVLDSVTFNSTSQNPDDYGTDPSRTVVWTLNDGSGSNNLSTAVTTTIGITPVNNPPMLSGTANATFTENGGAVTLSGVASVSDPDNLDLDGATVAISGGAFAGDVLAADTAGTSITASYDSSTEVLTLSGSDTLAHYQQVLASVTFNSTSQNPDDYGTDPSRTVVWTLNDGSGSNNLSTAVTTTVGITPVNNPPMLSATANATFTENGGAVTLSGAASVSDPDNLKLDGATVAISGGTFAGDSDVLAAATAGTSITASYNSSTEVLTLSGSDTLANYQAVLNSVTFNSTSQNPDDYGTDPSRTVVWTLNDGSASNATSTVTTTVNVTAVNDPPTLSNIAGSAQFTENNGAVTLSGAAAVSDSDNLKLAGATVAISGGTFAGDSDVLAADTAGTSITASYNSSTETLTLSGSDTLAHYQQVLDSVTFNSTSQNPDDYGTDPSRTVVWTLNDGSGSNNLSTAVTTTIGITPVNNPPMLSGTANATFTENGGAVTLSGVASVSDPDNLDLDGATVAISGGAFAGDVLAADTAGTSITASYDSSTEVLTLSGSDTLAHYQQVLASVTFNSTSQNPDDYGTDPSRTVVWTLNDGSGSNNLSTAVTTTIGITPVNNPPMLSATANATFTENGGAVTLSGAASVSDPDNLKLDGATVAISGGAFAGDVLAADTAGTSITASYDSSTEVLTLSGSDTLAHYQQVLDSVTFNSTSQNPDDYGTDPSRTVVWTLNDGSASNATSTVTTTVNVTPVNDPPTLSNIAGSAQFTENSGAVTLSGAASVSDPDNLNLDGATVAISGGAFAGDVLAADTAGTSITASYNSSTETLTLSGSDTLAHYQQVLASVTFNSTSQNPDDYGTDPSRTVVWTLNDGSGSNNLSTAVTTTVGITPVNNPPMLSGAANATFTENSGAVTLSGAAAVSDPDNLKLDGATVAISGGTFAGDGDVLAADTAGTSITASYNSSTETLTLSGSDTLANYQQVLDSVTFDQPGNLNPTDYNSDPSRTVVWTLNDGSASNATSTVTTTVNVTAINNPPTLASVATAVGFQLYQTVVLSPSVAVSDPDNLDLASATVKITGGAFSGDGDVLATSTAGTNITATYNSVTETLTLSGSDTLADYQTVLDRVTFSSGPTPRNGNQDPTRTVTWTLNDGSSSNNLSTAAATTISIAPAVKNDFNADLTSDIIFQDTAAAGGGGRGRGGDLQSGTPQVWLINNATVSAQANLTDPSVSWHIVGSADFSGDQKADILWQNSDGTPMIWAMNGTSVTSTTTLSDPGSSWQAVATGDFNGDGNPDILFQNTNGTPMIWSMSGTSVTSTTTLSDPGSSWRVVGTGDFNGDGTSDILFQNSDGTPMIWLMNGNSVTSTATLSDPGSSWRAVGTGDFDGHTDILFQNTDGTPMIETMNGASVTGTVTLANPGSSWTAVGTGNYTGTPQADILFQNTDGTPMIYAMNGTSVSSTVTLADPGQNWHANTG